MSPWISEITRLYIFHFKDENIDLRAKVPNLLTWLIFEGNFCFIKPVEKNVINLMRLFYFPINSNQFWPMRTTHNMIK